MSRIGALSATRIGEWRHSLLLPRSAASSYALRRHRFGFFHPFKEQRKYRRLSRLNRNHTLWNSSLSSIGSDWLVLKSCCGQAEMVSILDVKQVAFMQNILLSRFFWLKVKPTRRHCLWRLYVDEAKVPASFSMEAISSLWQFGKRVP